MTTVVSKPRILVVEDEVIVARDIQLQLVELGYEAVGHATRGDRAIVLCGELRPDLVLMDIQLAGPLDGIAAAQAIRTQFALPVVFLTALAEDDTLARAKLAEPLGYILKPFSERELRTTIEMALYRHQAEAKQRLSDHALKAVSQGVIITGIDQLIVSCNDAFVKITGYPKAEVLGRNCRFLQGPLTDPLTLKAIRLALLHQTDFSGEILNYRNDGVPFWNELTISPVRDAQGRATHFIGVTRDITPRKRADEKLRLSEESLAITLQSIGDAVIATNADGLITRLNATAERLTGWRWADAAGRSLSEVFRIFNSQTREAVKDPVQLVMERGEVVGLANHTVLLARDGSEYQIADSAAPIRDPAGQIVGVVLVFSDVTEAYRLRQTLERTANLLERTGEMAQVGGWELDLRTMLHLWSLETCRIFDVEPPGVPAVEQGFKFCAPAARPIIQAAVQAAIDTGAPYNLELPVITAKGRSIWVRAQGSAILEDGKVVKLIGAFQDITARKQAEESLRKNETQLLQATKMEALGKLSGGIAHDFNNLLTVILGHSEFALERLLPADPLRVNLEQIQAAGQRAAKLTQQLLAFSRKQVLQPKVVDLNQIVASVATLLRRIIGEDVQMEVVAARELWPVKADPDQLAQVLMNLAVNARDAMPQGGSITITTENVGSGNDPGLESGGQVRFTVSDTGMGMDETTLGHLFEPFFTTKALGKGTGLGLTTVYGIVKQSGGTLRVHSAPGRGSTFEVNLPRAVHEAVTLPVVASTQTLRGSETILLVEDEAPVRSVVHLMLAAYGYQVLEACDGREAMRILEAQSEMIALLLTDVIMPHVGGRQLAESVLRRWPHKRVLYMSGYTDDAVVRQGIVEARVGFLQKPLSADVLARKVRELLDTTANRASSPQSPQSHEVLRNRTLPLPTGSERILLVDDDEVVCLLATKNLQALGYQVAMAQSAAQALELWDQADGAFDLLLTDVRMPGAMSGQALGRCLRQRKTDLKVLIMSGYNEDRLAEFDSEAVADFLQKPYTRLELAQAVRNCLDGRGTL